MEQSQFREKKKPEPISIPDGTRIVVSSSLATPDVKNTLPTPDAMRLYNQNLEGAEHPLVPRIISRSHGKVIFAPSSGNLPSLTSQRLCVVNHKTGRLLQQGPLRLFIVIVTNIVAFANFAMNVVDLSDLVKKEKLDENNLSLAANSSEVKREPETDHPEIPVTQNHPEIRTIANEGPMISSNDFLASSNKSTINPMVGQHMVMPEHSGAMIGTLPSEPIDMGLQVEAKLERKRERNRAAATKCRQRKIHKIQTLEGHVQELTRKNEDLKSKRYELKEQLKQLEMKINENPQLREQFCLNHDVHIHRS